MRSALLKSLGVGAQVYRIVQDKWSGAHTLLNYTTVINNQNPKEVYNFQSYNRSLINHGPPVANSIYLNIFVYL